MRLILLILTQSLYSFLLLAQHKCYPTYAESKFLYHLSQKDSMPFLSQALANSGSYMNAIVETDKDFDNNGFKVDSCSNLYFKKAVNVIADLFKNNDIVVINEAHDYPANRFILAQILDTLKTLGIKDVFLETGAYDDSISVRGFPIQTSGMYFREPVFSNTIRLFQKNGINLHSYESTKGEYIIITNNGAKFFKDKFSDFSLEIKDTTLIGFYNSKSARNSQREVIQALNIVKKMQENNVKKALVYCGYAHAYKGKDKMANCLIKLNKKLVSIDQTLLHEHSKSVFEDLAFISHRDTLYSSIAFCNNVTPIKIKNYPEIIDFVMITPRLQYKNNRPTVLDRIGKKIRLNSIDILSDIKDSTDFLVMVYYSNEYEQYQEMAIPCDIFEIDNFHKRYDFILEPNKKYIVTVQKWNRIFYTKKFNTNG